MKARGHKLEDKDLKVVDVVRNQLLLGSLPHCVSEDLKHFVEVKASSALKTVKFGEDGSVAIVTFEEEIGELQTVIHCQERFRVCDVQREKERTGWRATKRKIVTLCFLAEQRKGRSSKERI